MSQIYEHHVLAIFPQDKWKDRFKQALSEGVIQGFWNASGSADCHTCCTCEVCRGLVELFDPNSPSEYNNACKLCFIFEIMFKKKLGRKRGIVLVAHWTKMPDAVIEQLYKDEHIKKVYVLNHSWEGQDKDTDVETILSYIKHEKISYSGFMSLEEKELGTAYEIIRDEYWR